MSDSPKITFKGKFRACKDWNDPRVINKLRRQALAVVQASLKGQKVDRDRLEAAKFVVGKLVADQAPKQVQVNFITWQQVQEAVTRTGMASNIPPLPVGRSQKTIGGNGGK